jgi:hypothetical protein
LNLTRKAAVKLFYLISRALTKSKYISQPRQKLNTAFKKAAARANAVAMRNTVELPMATPIKPTTPNKKPTN